jgi:hypothetical protein
MEFLHGNARAMIRMMAMDAAVLFPEPFGSGVLDWPYEANAGTDRALRRPLLRLNAYDLPDLSEEIMGDIHQGFLPEPQRRRIGEFQTPPALVDWIPDRTGAGRMADPETARRIHRALRRRPGPGDPGGRRRGPGEGGSVWREAGMRMRRRPKDLRGLGGPLAAPRFRLEDPIARADFAARLRERGDLAGLLLLAMAWEGEAPFIR